MPRIRQCVGLTVTGDLTARDTTPTTAKRHKPQALWLALLSKARRSRSLRAGRPKPSRESVDGPEVQLAGDDLHVAGLLDAKARHPAAPVVIAVEPLDHGIHLLANTLDLGGHRTVRLVEHPARGSHGVGKVGGGPAEAHALHRARKAVATTHLGPKRAIAARL